MLFVISGPSGAGKTTIIKELFKKLPGLTFSVSATTRAKRKDEINKRDYYFISKKEFQDKAAKGEFVEWEEVHGSFYGTLKDELDTAVGNKTDIVFDVDVKGALSIKKMYPDAVTIFVEVPKGELMARLKGRQTDTKEQIHKRIERIKMEMEKKRFFDYVIMNKTEESGVSKALNQIVEIIKHNKTK